MAICKCKMCGGDLHIEETDKVVECEYCGTTQTVPSADSEKKMTLFNRANRLRLANEFDKAAGPYENIIAEFPEEAEAYWGLCLCNYGIEYVDDPTTGKKIPTCHRASFQKLREDENFELAMEYADVTAQKVYRDEAREIDRINEEILSVSKNETPYDIFICYKETDESGSRTPDSVMAQDIYDALTAKGYKVFFARISLEDKLGQQYEPYIFAALNSAKIMLCVGTKYEYFHAVWVKNEWSRFVRLAAKDKTKMLIPCYKDMDPYDLPDAFKGLQAQDLGKLGAMQDLVRGVEKLLSKDKHAAPNAVVDPAEATVDSLLKRAFMFLEDGEWQSADEYAERVLDIEPENGEAYLAKLMAEFHVRRRADLSSQEFSLEGNNNYKKAVHFGTNNGIAELLTEANEKNKHKQMAAIIALDECRQKIRQVYGLIATGISHTVSLKKDGTVVTTGSNKWGQCEVPDWSDIIAIAAGYYQTIGLKMDGTVVAIGRDPWRRLRKLADWRDIIAIATCEEDTVGLKKDGTVVAVSPFVLEPDGVSSWRDIVAVAVGSRHKVGLKKDGTVLVDGSNSEGQCNVSGWRDIVAVAAGSHHTVGLKKDGTVLSTGDNRDGQCNVSDWREIVAVAARGKHTIGLKKDGTVVATNYLGNDYHGQCDVSNWKEIVAIDTSLYHTVGLKKDGRVVAVGSNEDNKCNVENWRLFDNYLTVEQERIAAKEEARKKAEKQAEQNRILAERKRQKELEQQQAAKRERLAKLSALIASLQKEQATLEAELPMLKGIFKASRRKEAEARLAEIKTELTKLTK